MKNCFLLHANRIRNDASEFRFPMGFALVNAEWLARIAPPVGNEPPRDIFCAFIVSNRRDTNGRGAMLDALASYRHVNSYGRVGNNTRFPGRLSGLPAREQCFAVYQSCRFVLCFENSRADNYITEKLLIARAAGAVPIYRGAANIAEYFNPRAFVAFDEQASVEAVVERGAGTAWRRGGVRADAPGAVLPAGLPRNAEAGAAAFRRNACRPRPPRPSPPLSRRRARNRETSPNNPGAPAGAPVSDHHRAAARNQHQQPRPPQSHGLERRSPTGIARQRETSTNNAVERRSPTVHRAVARNQHQQRPAIARKRETSADNATPRQPPTTIARNRETSTNNAVERRSPTGIARKRETSAKPAQRLERRSVLPVGAGTAARSGASGAVLIDHKRRAGKGTPTSGQSSGGGRRRYATRSKITHRQPRKSAGTAWSAGLRPASRVSAKPAPTTPGAPVSDRHRAEARARNQHQQRRPPPTKPLSPCRRAADSARRWEPGTTCDANQEAGDPSFSRRRNG